MVNTLAFHICSLGSNPGQSMCQGSGPHEPELGNMAENSVDCQREEQWPSG